MDEWPQQTRIYNPQAPAKIVEQARREEAVTQLEDARTLFHPHMDGIIPPTVRTKAERCVFMEELESVSNKYAADELHQIQAGEELESFLQQANGVAAFVIQGCAGGGWCLLGLGTRLWVLCSIATGCVRDSSAAWWRLMNCHGRYQMNWR